MEIIHIGRKERKMKTTKCVSCGEDIEQGVKEGQLFCPDCAEKYIERVKDEVDKIGLDCEDIKVDIKTFTYASNISNKHTILILFGYRNCKRLEVWLETNKILKLFRYNSSYIWKYIQACIEASYWFSLSARDYMIEQKEEINKNK